MMIRQTAGDPHRWTVNTRGGFLAAVPPLPHGYRHTLVHAVALIRPSHLRKLIHTRLLAVSTPGRFPVIASPPRVSVSFSLSVYLCLSLSLSLSPPLSFCLVCVLVSARGVLLCVRACVRACACAPTFACMPH